MLLWSLGFLGTAAAAPEAAHDHEAADHGHDAAESHGDSHHVSYTADEDGDGVPNWRDPKNGEVDNEAYVLWPVGWHTVNFIVLIAIGVYVVRRPFLDLFRERATAIRHELTDTARKRDEAHHRHQELLARLEKIEGEVQAMESEALLDAQREEAKLIERAKREALRIGEQAQRNIRDEARRASFQLRREAVELAISLAQATLRDSVAKKDHQDLAKQFLESMKGVGRV